MPEDPKIPRLTVRALRGTPVEVPLNFVLGTSAVAVRKAPLLLVDLETEEGVTGRTYLFCYLPAAAPAIVSLLAEVERIVKGRIVAPADLWKTLARRFTLIGVQGIVRMAMSAFDAAAWDALAIAAREPLAGFIGAVPRRIPAYNSCGLGLKDDLGELADEAEKLLAGGFRAVKLRLGYPTLREDIDALYAVRKRIGDSVALMVDYNQALTREDALVRGRALDIENIYWLEEPIRHDDYAGNARLVDELKVPVQIGENFSLPAAMTTAIEQHAADFVMPDLERIGGVTGWIEAARIAHAHDLKMSSHLFPEVSAHLLAATPTAHFLEYVDWASVLLEEPLAVSDGYVQAPARPGNGMVWNKKAVERYRMQ
ncbi:MAG TPA: enolase C-terminal domain-like protein [Pseudolabrys sp.]|nr:enolase C-terminal domain-like protein [Pseudolabrys sp.]